MIIFAEKKKEMLENKKIILASGSPRRKELLGGLEIEFEVRLIKGIDESYPSNLEGGEIPMYISEKKASAYELGDDELLITSDTIVWNEGEVMGKPKDAEEAKKMLRQLSGKTHNVYTGVCIKTKDSTETFFDKSEVTMADMTDEEIEHYVEKYKPMDKAGSYGIQEWIGYTCVENINGSYYNIMGLPVQALYKHLKKYESK